MKYFIAHYTPLTDRKIHILSELNKHGIKNYEFITTNDKEDVRRYDKSRFSTINPLKYLYL